MKSSLLSESPLFQPYVAALPFLFHPFPFFSAGMFMASEPCVGVQGRVSRCVVPQRGDGAATLRSRDP